MKIAQWLTSPLVDSRGRGRGLGVEEGALVAIGGHSGETWGAGEHVLRVKAATAMDRELAACAATSGVVPTAEVHELAS